MQQRPFFSFFFLNDNYLSPGESETFRFTDRVSRSSSGTQRSKYPITRPTPAKQFVLTEVCLWGTFSGVFVKFNPPRCLISVWGLCIQKTLLNLMTLFGLLVWPQLCLEELRAPLCGLTALLTFSGCSLAFKLSRDAHILSVCFSHKIIQVAVLGQTVLATQYTVKIPLVWQLRLPQNQIRHVFYLMVLSPYLHFKDFLPVQLCAAKTDWWRAWMSHDCWPNEYPSVSFNIKAKKKIWLK